MKVITLRTRLRSSTLELKGVKQLLGKDVEVTIKEVAGRKSVSRNWKNIGKLTLKGKLDKTNIRDVAYE